MNFNQAKGILESQTIEVGIGFFLTGKKLSDFGPVFEEDPGKFKDIDEYNEKKEAFEKKTRELYEAEKELRDPDVKLIFRQPTLDELMKISGKSKEFPSYLNKDIPEIAALALQWDEAHSTSAVEQIDNSLAILEKCYITDTFEDKGKRTGKEVCDFLRMSRELSVDVVSKFFDSVGK